MGISNLAKNQVKVRKNAGVTCIRVPGRIMSVVVKVRYGIGMGHIIRGNGLIISFQG